MHRSHSDSESNGSRDHSLAKEHSHPISAEPCTAIESKSIVSSRERDSRTRAATEQPSVSVPVIRHFRQFIQEKPSSITTMPQPPASYRKTLPVGKRSSGMLAMRNNYLRRPRAIRATYMNCRAPWVSSYQDATRTFHRSFRRPPLSIKQRQDSCQLDSSYPLPERQHHPYEDCLCIERSSQCDELR